MAAKPNPVGRPKTQYDPKREITFKELLDIKIEHYKNTPKIKNCSEKVLCDQIEIELPEIMEALGLGYVAHYREMGLLTGRADILVKNDSENYTIIEAKHSRESYNYDVYFATAIGQLMYYRMALGVKYEIPKEQIKLIIAIDEDSLSLHSILGIENLDISVIVYGHNGIKYYGNTSKS